jgi:regulator of replication initiation timing
VDPYEIEDTSDWLESPTQLDTIRHYAHMLEDEIQELKLELRSAKENISGLVDMNDQLSAKCKKLRTWMANLEAETTEQLAKIHSLSMVRDQNDKLRSELEAAKRQ